MNVKIAPYTALNLLMDRVEHWTDEQITLELFEQYYERMIDEGCFEGCDFDVMMIVDNDYINWFNVMNEKELAETFDESEEDTRDRIYAEVEDGDDKYYLVYMC